MDAFQIVDCHHKRLSGAVWVDPFSSVCKIRIPALACDSSSALAENLCIYALTLEG